MSTNLKIAKAYTILVAASVLGHALSMVKEIIGANYFGISKAMDSFYVALTVPNLINSVFLSPFVIIFIPILIKYRTKDLGEANRIISTVSNIVLIVLAAAAIIAFVFAARLITLFTPGLDPKTAADAGRMLKILSAGIIFTGAANILIGVINAFEHFLWPAISGMFITLSTIFFMLFFTDRLGIFVLGWGLLAGTILQVLFLTPVAKRQGFHYSGTLDLEHPEIRKSLNLTFIFLIITVLGGLNTVVNRFMASWLPDGSIAGLAYADKLVQVPLVIFSGAIATSIYPFLSAQAAANRIEDIKNTVSLSIRMSGFIFVPLAGTMIILARPMIQLLFQRGAFDAAATELTSHIFVFSVAAIAIMQRLLFAFQDFKSILKIIFASLLITLTLNFTFIKIMDPPACGIALATSLGSFISAVLYFAVLKRRIANLHGLAILGSFLRVTAFSLVSGLIVFFTYKALSAVFHATLFDQVIALGASSCAGLSGFILISALFKLEEFHKVYHLVRARFRPGPEATA